MDGETIIQTIAQTGRTYAHAPIIIIASCGSKDFDWK